MQDQSSTSTEQVLEKWGENLQKRIPSDMYAGLGEEKTEDGSVEMLHGFVKVVSVGVY